MEQDAFKKVMQAHWSGQLSTLFDGTIPSSAEWTNPDDIQRVLSTITGPTNLVFYPDGGAEGMQDCWVTEEGYLEWSFHPGGLAKIAKVVRPLKLTFWNPGGHQHEANFVLEVAGLAPVGRLKDRTGVFEEVVELANGTYEPLSSWHNSQCQSGQDLPQGARRLTRTIKPARYAIFGKGSRYNRYHLNQFDAYHGLHNDPAKFITVVEEMANLS